MHDLAAAPLEAAAEVKFCALDLKSVGDDGRFEGYASLFDRQDLGGDIVAPGAFRGSLAARGTSGVRMLFQHDPNQPIGAWERIAEDARGLHARGRLAMEVAKAREIAGLMRAGALDGLSIGFRAERGMRNPRTGLRRLEKIDLWEISIVTFPMQPEARVDGGKVGSKSGPFRGRTPTTREFERWLTQDAGFTRSEARALMRSGIEGLSSLRDAGRASGWELRLAAQMREAASLLRRTA